ncbi:MAG: RsmD family RNA methyltransferase [Thermomicrobia bacterium]|nr:RsmD family RNA methyltransferase [Thermomicrobia bacterium]
MRVIAGEAKGHRLKAPKGMLTRPMADKIKGAVFSMLASLGIESERVVDLYAGSGAVGIEFLSRGATWLDAVEQRQDAAAVIADNLAHTKFTARAQVHKTTVQAFLARPTIGPYDTVMMDPPYADSQIAAVMDLVASRAPDRGILPGAVLVIGHSPRVALPAQVRGFGLLRKRCHGDSCFSIYLEGHSAEPAGVPDVSLAEKDGGA